MKKLVNTEIKMPFLILLMIAPFVISAQVSTGKTITYANGNKLIIGSRKFELKSPDDATLCVWDEQGDVNQLKNIKYQKIFKNSGITKKEGLFNSGEGIVVVEPVYDGVTPSRFENGVIFTRMNKKFGLAHFEGYPVIKAVFDNVYFYPNGSCLLKSNTTGYIVDEHLKVTDSISGFKTIKSIWSTRRRRDITAVISTHGISLIDEQGKLIVHDNSWIDAFEEFLGGNLIISSKAGVGLYNIDSNKAITSFKYRNYKIKDWLNDKIILAEKNQCSLFDSSGKKLLDVRGDSIIPALEEWSGFFFRNNNKWGFISVEGKILQQPIWKWISDTKHDYFEGLLMNGKSNQYYYEYKELNGRLIVSEVKEGIKMTLPSK